MNKALSASCCPAQLIADKVPYCTDKAIQDRCYLNILQKQNRRLARLRHLTLKFCPKKIYIVLIFKFRRIYHHVISLSSEKYQCSCTTVSDSIGLRTYNKIKFIYSFMYHITSLSVSSITNSTMKCQNVPMFKPSVWNQ